MWVFDLLTLGPSIHRNYIGLKKRENFVYEIVQENACIHCVQYSNTIITCTSMLISMSRQHIAALKALLIAAQRAASIDSILSSVVVAG